MPMVQVQFRLYLPAWLHGGLRRVKHALFPPAPVPITIWGERHVEWTFISARIPGGPGEALDFGCEAGYLSLLAATRGFRVVALDLQPQTFPWQHPDIRFVQGDVLKMDLPENHFDLVLCCSTVEHIGLAGRYGVSDGHSDGDLQAMDRLRCAMKPDATLLLTLPCGRDAVMAPWHRVYGVGRLPQLLRGFAVVEEQFWAKDGENRWSVCDRSTALTFQPTVDPEQPSNSSYALGGFVLGKAGSPQGSAKEKA